MVYSIDQIEIGTWLVLNSETLTDELKDEFQSQLKRRDTMPSGMYLQQYDKVLAEEMFKFLLHILQGMFIKNAEEIAVICDVPYIKNHLAQIVRRSLYE